MLGGRMWLVTFTSTQFGWRALGWTKATGRLWGGALLTRVGAVNRLSEDEEEKEEEEERKGGWVWGSGAVTS